MPIRRLAYFLIRRRVHEAADLPDYRFDERGQRYPVWEDLITRARAAVTNWRHETVDQG